jgi:hypothetical protein
LNTTKHETECTRAVQQLVAGGAGLSSERAIDRKDIQRVLPSPIGCASSVELVRSPGQKGS